MRFNSKAYDKLYPRNLDKGTQDVVVEDSMITEEEPSEDVETTEESVEDIVEEGGTEDGTTGISDVSTE